MSFTYKSLSAQLQKHVITDEEVDRQLHRLQQQTPRVAKVQDRPAQLGDEVVLDYAGFCNGEQFAGGTAQNQSLVLGSGMFIPGFEEQLVDKVPGEEVIVKVTFPESYHAEELAGKAAEFRCTIHEIRVKSAYELDDVFAKEVGGCDTLDEMREVMKESMQNYSDHNGEMELQDSLLRQAAATLDFTISEEELEKAVDEQMNTLEAQLAQQGLNLEMYCSFMSTTVEDLRKDARPAAEAAARNQAAVEKVAELENIQAEEKDIAATLDVICRQNNMTMEQLQQHYTPEFEKAVLRSVITAKVMSVIRENAQITEV
ncbi:MAG: trigger factor [Oscillospiraceae bacterium]|nr:trigger factor [Oscillospiraceae bacterium]